MSDLEPWQFSDQRFNFLTLDTRVSSLVLPEAEKEGALASKTPR